HLPSHQEFCRDIADRAAEETEVSARGVDPAMQQTVADRIRQCHVVVVLSDDSRKPGLPVSQVVAESASNGCGTEAGTDVLRFSPRFDGRGGQFSSHRSFLPRTVAGIASEFKIVRDLLSG